MGLIFCDIVEDSALRKYQVSKSGNTLDAEGIVTSGDSSPLLPHFIPTHPAIYYQISVIGVVS